MEWTSFLTTVGLIFVAELGDKTQLTAMTLATRYPWRDVFIGIAAAFALLNLAAVGVGEILFSLVPMTVIQGVSGILFLIFGLFTLRNSGKTDEEKKEMRLGGALATAFVLILLSELGDKTQIVTAALAAQYHNFLSVFAGSTLALWGVSLLGIFLGKTLTRVLPMRVIHRGAGILFLILGVGMLLKLASEGVL
ncbi:MAG: TMEM165/GDT1 family protein [Nitrospirae bacterium]|nr:TMEM165/GDT1 family protein [Nitrospirota bacterium]